MKIPGVVAAMLLFLSTAAAQETAASEPASKPASAPALPADELARYRAAGAYAVEKGSFAFLVRKGGAVVYEQYAEGRSPDQDYPIASGTKSFWGVCAICMVEDKLLSSLDEKVCDTIVEWKDDPRKSRITVRMLLQLHSGLPPEQEKYSGIQVADKYAEAIREPLLDEPGSRFRYGAVAYYVFGALAKRKLKGGDPLEYLKHRVLEPIGMKVTRWTRDGEGNPNMPHGAWVSAREWSKFGDWLKCGGLAGGKQIVASALIEELHRPSPTNLAYGMTFWRALGDPEPAAESRPESIGEAVRERVRDRVRERMSESAMMTLPAGTFMAAGAGSQLCVVIPKLDLVIVRIGRLVEGDFRRDVMLKLALPPAEAKER